MSDEGAVRRRRPMQQVSTIHRHEYQRVCCAGGNSTGDKGVDVAVCWLLKSRWFAYAFRSSGRVHLKESGGAVAACTCPDDDGQATVGAGSGCVERKRVRKERELLDVKPIQDGNECSSRPVHPRWARTSRSQTLG